MLIAKENIILKEKYYREIRNTFMENELSYSYSYPNNSDYLVYASPNEMNFSEMRYINIGKIKGATLDKILEWLGSPRSLEFRDIMIITHENFVSSIEFFKRIIKHFMIPWPMSMSTKEVSEMLKERYRIIQNKLLGFLQYWVAIKWYDFTKDKEIRVLLDTWIEFIRDETEYYKFNVKQIQGQLIPLLKRADDRLATPNLHGMGVGFDPKPMTLPSSIVYYHDLIAGHGLLEFPTDLIVAQLALIDQNLFCKLSPRDFMTKKAKEVGGRQPMRILMDRHNLFTSFVTAYIIKETSQANREQLMEKFCELIKKCLEISNINCAFMIYSALSSYGNRLERSWPKVMTKYKKNMDEWDKIFAPDDDYFSLRDIIKSREPPCVPCFHIWNKDMEVISQLYKEDYLDKNKGIINMFRQAVIADRMKEFESFQKVMYKYYKFPIFYDFLEYDYIRTLSLVMTSDNFLEPVYFLEIVKIIEPALPTN